MDKSNTRGFLKSNQSSSIVIDSVALERKVSDTKERLYKSLSISPPTSPDAFGLRSGLSLSMIQVGGGVRWMDSTSIWLNTSASSSR